MLEIITALEEKYGKNERINTGVKQVCSCWADKDGNDEQLKSFCLQHFVKDGEELEDFTLKFEKYLNAIFACSGHARMYTSETIYVDKGTITPLDVLFSSYNPLVELIGKMFEIKTAFAALLNFPVYTFDEKNTLGREWNDSKWVQVRIADIFAERDRDADSSEYSKAYAKASAYCAGKINLEKISVGGKNNIFPPDSDFIRYSNYIRSYYTGGGMMEKAKIILKISDRKIRHEIPEIFIKNRQVSWDPFTNKVWLNGIKVSPEPEKISRYDHLLNMFHARQLKDRHSKLYPNLISETFEELFQISEVKTREFCTSVLESEALKKCCFYLEKKLGRNLCAEDWYYSPNMIPDGGNSNSVLASKYPNIKSLEKAIPDILKQLGFSEEKSSYISSLIAVEQSRSSSHCLPGGHYFKTKIRINAKEDQITFAVFNTFMHELGHAVNMILSGEDFCRTVYASQPNYVFSEAFAFLFANKAKKLLEANTENSNDEKVINLWEDISTYGISLLNIDIWQYMYQNETLTAKELKNFMIARAIEIWNQYYAEIYNHQDSTILASPFHLITYGIYYPSYLYAAIAQAQIEHYIKDKNFAGEIERMSSLESCTPDLWMEKATGSPLSIDCLLKEAEKEADELLT